MPNDELRPAIRLFEQKYRDAEEKAKALLMTLNMMREEAGMPAFKPDSGAAGGGSDSPVNTEIKSDTFFGKRQQTAVREYLEMRRASGGEGPATPREIYEALVSGGYKYQAKDADTALVGLRALLRKRSNVFIKVGGGAYGLVSWYPEAKASRPKSSSTQDDDDEDDDEAEHMETADYDEASSAA